MVDAFQPDWDLKSILSLLSGKLGIPYFGAIPKRCSSDKRQYSDSKRNEQGKKDVFH